MVINSAKLVLVLDLCKVIVLPRQLPWGLLTEVVKDKVTPHYLGRTSLEALKRAKDLIVESLTLRREKTLGSK